MVPFWGPPKEHKITVKFSNACMRYNKTYRQKADNINS